MIPVCSFLRGVRRNVVLFEHCTKLHSKLRYLDKTFIQSQGKETLKEDCTDVTEQISETTLRSNNNHKAIRLCCQRVFAGAPLTGGIYKTTFSTKRRFIPTDLDRGRSSAMLESERYVYILTVNPFFF